NIIVGRADDGRRPGVASRVLRRARAALDAGDDDSPRDAVSRRGGALSPRGAHARRAPAPDRHAGRATPEPRAAAPGRARDRCARRGEHERAGGAVAIGARGLSKTFGGFVAGKGIDLEVRYGEVYGLLGANGAGKTTTIKMLCGLLEPCGGEVRLAGEVGELRSEEVRQQVGYMSQKFSLYDDLTIDENLDFFAGVYQVPRERREARKRWVLDFAGLPGKGGQLTGSLPGGWKQR